VRERLFADLTADPRIRAAAAIGNTFKLNPIDVLRSPRRDWLILLAASDVIAEAKTPVDKH
jgi:hypothetical protein